MVDVNGLIVGVVSAKLDDVEILKASGSFPQNVNFAIRGDLAQAFLRANGVDPMLRDPSTSTPWTISEVVKHSQAFTMHVICAGVAKTAAVQR
jgi:hypothetical protein